MSEFVYLYRGGERSDSPALAEKEMQKWVAWMEDLGKQGHLKDRGQPLEREGKIVSGKNRVVSDGPFAESKEAIGGYFYLTVTDENEAIEIAKQCPGLEYGSVVEVRPVADEWRDHPSVFDLIANDIR